MKLFSKKIKYLLSLGLVFYTTSSLAISKSPWPHIEQVNSSTANPYYYFFENDTLRTALIKMGQSFEINVHFSDDLTDDIKKKKITGRFKVFSPEELYNKFADNFGYTWFFYDGVLYIEPNNFVTKNLYVAAELLSNFKNILASEGLLDNKFGWSEIPSENMIVVSGPKDYIKLINKKMLTLNIAPVDQQFAVFRLKYANATDITINTNSAASGSGNASIVIPGVATILKAMLNPGADSNTANNNKILQQVIEPLKNNLKSILPNNANLAGDGVVQDEKLAPNAPAGEQRNRSSLTTPIIQADNRLNTVIIRDKSGNLPIYKALIDLLDVPAPLIQIEVLILDIDQLKINQAGINWWGSTGRGLSGGFGGNNISKSPSPGTPSLAASWGSVSPGNLVVNNIAGFAAGLNFLENKGYAKTAAKSAVVTIDNIAAVVNLTQSMYTSPNKDSQPQSINASMQMQITAHLIYDDKDKRRITLSVALQDGNVEEKTINGMPSTIQGTLNSQAVIEEGSSLLLAGFSRKQKEEVESKVPILGDIPILGLLFKDKSVKDYQIQRSYLVTPKVIWSDRNNMIPNYSILNHRDKDKVN